MPTITYRQARNYTNASRKIGDVDVLVFHDMEYPERLDTAEAVAAWFAGSNAPRASTHYNHDIDSIVRSVLDEDVAWCAPGRNHNGIHFEHAGYARQTRSEWLDDYGKAMLDLSGWNFARVGNLWNVPLKKLSVAEVSAGKRGIISHWDLTLAGIAGNNHTDPGKNFPWDYFLEECIAKYSDIDPSNPDSKPTKPTPRIPGTTLPVLRRDGWLGYKTIRAMQTLMKKRGYAIKVDGKISEPSMLVEAMQRELRYKRKQTCKHGNVLKLDGLGIQSNENGRYPETGYTHTLEACQLAEGWSKSSTDGYLSAPSGLVKEWQTDINRGKFLLSA